MILEPKREKSDITKNRTSHESHIHCKDHFHRNPFHFKVYADFEAHSEKDNSIVGRKTTNIYKQNSILNGYHIKSEFGDVLQNSYYKPPLGYNIVDWFCGRSYNIRK